MNTNNGWLGIASAPKDGKLILLGCPDEGPDGRPALCLPGHWMKGWSDAPDEMGQDDGWVDVQHTDFYPGRSFGNPDYMHKGSQPTHWMPLPAAPGSPASTVADEGAKEVIDWHAVTARIAAYAEDYELRGEDDHGREGCYQPNETERGLIIDAIHGLLADDEFMALIRPAAPAAGDALDRLVDRLAGMAYSFAVRLDQATRGANDDELVGVARRVTADLKAEMRAAISASQQGGE